jgi:hypothetical protein
MDLKDLPEDLKATARPIKATIKTMKRDLILPQTTMSIIEECSRY